MIIQLTSNSGCDYLIQQNLAAKLFQEAVAKGATDRDALYNIMVAAKNMSLMLVPPVFLFPVLSGNHKFAVRLKNDVG